MASSLGWNDISSVKWKHLRTYLRSEAIIAKENELAQPAPTHAQLWSQIKHIVLVVNTVFTL